LLNFGSSAENCRKKVRDDHGLKYIDTIPIISSEKWKLPIDGENDKSLLSASGTWTRTWVSILNG
jgi:hypothetical protein